MTNVLSQAYTGNTNAAPLIQTSSPRTIVPAPTLAAENDNQVLSPETVLVRRRRRARSRLAR